AAGTPILISENFYRQGDRYREENGEKIDRFITGEFIAGTVYGCQVVVTNPTSARQKLSVLIQLPIGAIPVGNRQTTTTPMRERHTYQPALWSYSLYHNAPAAAGQYLLHVDQIVNECGGLIQSPLLSVDPVARHQYEHLEYKPLINARAHSLGHRRQIVNARL